MSKQDKASNQLSSDSDIKSETETETDTFVNNTGTVSGNVKVVTSYRRSSTNFLCNLANIAAIVYVAIRLSLHLFDVCTVKGYKNNISDVIIIFWIVATVFFTLLVLTMLCYVFLAQALNTVYDSDESMHDVKKAVNGLTVLQTCSSITGACLFFSILTTNAELSVTDAHLLVPLITSAVLYTFSIGFVLFHYVEGNQSDPIFTLTAVFDLMIQVLDASSDLTIIYLTADTFITVFVSILTVIEIITIAASIPARLHFLNTKWPRFSKKFNTAIKFMLTVLDICALGVEIYLLITEKVNATLIVYSMMSTIYVAVSQFLKALDDLKCVKEASSFMGVIQRPAHNTVSNKE